MESRRLSGGKNWEDIRNYSAGFTARIACLSKKDKELAYPFGLPGSKTTLMFTC